MEADLLTEGVLQAFHDHRDHLLGLLRRNHSVLQGSEHPEAARMVQVRRTVLRALHDYQQFKHAEIFDPLIARGDLPLAADVARLKRDSVRFADDYDAYIDRWTLYDIIDDWPRYREQAMLMIEHVIRHIDHETEMTERLIDTSRR